MAVLLAEITISLFAVFGLYAAVRFFCALLLAPRELCATLEIKTSLSAEAATFLYCRAKEFLPTPRSSRVVVLVSDTLDDRSAVLAHFQRLGADCYLVHYEEGG